MSTIRWADLAGQAFVVSGFAIAFDAISILEQVSRVTFLAAGGGAAARTLLAVGAPAIGANRVLKSLALTAFSAFSENGSQNNKGDEDRHRKGSESGGFRVISFPSFLLRKLFEACDLELLQISVVGHFPNHH